MFTQPSFFFGGVALNRQNHLSFDGEFADYVETFARESAARRFADKDRFDELGDGSFLLRIAFRPLDGRPFFFAAAHYRVCDGRAFGNFVPFLANIDGDVLVA